MLPAAPRGFPGDHPPMRNPPPPPPTPGKKNEFDDELAALVQRLYREGVLAVELLEGAIDAFKRVDRDQAARVRKRDDEVDREEVLIEEEAIRLIALHQPVAVDLRRLMLVIKVNADIERIADHAAGVCKTVLYLKGAPAPTWPTSLVDMADRVLPRAHETLRAFQSQDDAAAERIIKNDRTLDILAKRAFEEIEQTEGAGRISANAALLAFRASRELERVSDLLGSICEDIIYMQTGRIVRHTKNQDAPPR